VRPLAEIRDRPGDDARAGTLRRGDLDAFGRVLDAIGGGSVLVTGVGDGREEVSIGLAATAAARGVRTALVECDLEDPRLAARLGIAERPGLHEYLRRQAEAPEILQPLALAGPATQRATEPLVCVVAGERAANGAEPIASDEYRHAAARLRDAYQLVVLLGPPLAEEAAALPQAAAWADCVLACVGPSLASGRAGRRVTRALRALPAGRTEVIVCS
jgi:MinD-like ATPase involved in chromosome partitioning or flagellar assembly